MADRVLFLDMDGVLQSRRSIVAYRRGANPLRPYPLDEVAVKLMQRTIEETGAYVVISSHWRGFGTARAAAWFANYGWYDAPILDETPTRTDYREACRGDVIQQWVDEHEPSRYVIVDDSSDMLPHQPLVHVDGEEGYQWKDHERAVSLLTCGHPYRKQVNRFLEMDPQAEHGKGMALDGSQLNQVRRLHNQTRS